MRAEARQQDDDRAWYIMAHTFEDLVTIMARLRAPGGCPWDRKQTHETLKPYLLEETYEVLETIDQADFPKLKEELGDVLLQILFHAQIGKEGGTFTIEEVLATLAEKLVRRHPHVFGETSESHTRPDADEVYSKWEQIKREERRQSGRKPSALDGVPKTLPALLQAYQIQARASRVGFDWPENSQGLEQILKKVQEEIQELGDALQSHPERPAGTHVEDGESRTHGQVEGELGDVLFSVVNLARFVKVNPEDALRLATNRFSERFHFIEAEAAKTGRRMEELTLAEMEQFWERAKAREAADRTDGESSL